MIDLMINQDLFYQILDQVLKIINCPQDRLENYFLHQLTLIEEE